MQKIKQFDGKVVEFEPLPGSDVWPTALIPTSCPWGRLDSTDSLPELIKEYDLYFRINVSSVAVRGRLVFEALINCVNAGFRYLESTDNIVRSFGVNDGDWEAVKSGMQNLLMLSSNEDGLSCLWGAKCFSSELIPKGHFIVEYPLLEDDK